MPDACRAASPQASRRALLLDFLEAILDAAIREGGTRDALEEGADPIGRWLGALQSEDARVAGSAAEKRVLREEIEAWTAPLRTAAAAAPFRTCFRLEEPREEAEARRLEFEIRAADDASLRVPARRVWRAERFVEQRFPGAAERLLGDLARAARLRVPIERSLRASEPERCSPDVAGARRFLRETSVLLEESGFGVVVPG